MESRNNLQIPLTRPLSQSSGRDPRQAPIPPLPYTLQAPPHRLQPSLNNDPFLPRRNERDESRQEPPKPLSQGPFTVGSYAASLPRDALGTTMELRERPQDNNHSGSWTSRIGDGRADRYRQYTTEGEDHIACHAGDVCVCFVSFVAAYRILNLSAFPITYWGA